tara:strand:- start:10084 stop:12558 length:2475 start_codon:yes stop_codon:yes gene_type:complete
VNKEQKERLRLLQEQEAVLLAINAEYKTLGKANKDILNIAQKLTDEMSSEKRLSEKQLVSMQAKLKAAMARAAFDEKNLEIEKETEKYLNRQLEKRREVNKALGIGGSVIKSLAGSLGSFGKSLGLEDAAIAMEKVAYNAVDAEKSISKMSVLATGLTSIGKSMADNLLDPTVIIGGMVNSFQDLQKAEQEFRQQTGTAADYNFQLLNGSMATSTDYLKGMVALTKEIGVNAQASFSQETITEVAELTEFMGLSAKSAATLAKLSKKSGQELSVVKDNIAAGTADFIRQNNVSINLKDVMEEVGNASASIQVSMGGSAGAIQEAAMEAKKLGLSLEQVDNIAGSILDFESSIAAEMEAELLTGVQLNLENARSLALNNDLAGLSKEIGNNAGINLAFTQGNRIQQEALAKSLGISRDEMAAMILQQDAQRLGSIEAAALAQGMSQDEAERLNASQQLEQSIAKITQELAKPVAFIASLLSNTVALNAVMISIGAVISLKVLGSLKDSLSTAKDLYKSMTNIFASSGGGGGGSGGGIADSIKDAISPDADKKGEATEGFLESLGKGLASIGKSAMNVIKGAAALGVASIVLAGSFFLASKIMMTVDPIAMIKFAGALTVFGIAAAVLGKISSQVIMGSLAIGVLGLALIPAAYAFSLLADVDTNKMIAFSIMLPLLGLAMAGLGLIAPFVMAGALALGVMALALVPLALMGPGLSLATTALMGMATALKEVGTSLNDIDSSKLEALEDFAVTSAVTGAASGIASAIASPIAALGGMLGGGGDDNTQQEIVSRLDRLIAVVESGGDVILDGNKVGRNLSLASSGIG